MISKEKNKRTVEQIQSLMPMKSQLPEFSLTPSETHPENAIIDRGFGFHHQLLETGFIYSHEIRIDNAVGQSKSTSIVAYLNVNSGSYALLTDLFHDRATAIFTNYYAQGHRLVTAENAGDLVLNSSQFEPMPELHWQETGDTSLEAQWKKHQKQASILFPEQHSLLLKPDQHLLVERGFYLRYLNYLLECGAFDQVNARKGAKPIDGETTLHSALSQNANKRNATPVLAGAAKLGQRARKPLGLAVAASLLGLSVYVSLPGLKNLQASLSAEPTAATPQVAAALARPTTRTERPATPLNDSGLRSIVAGRSLSKQTSPTTESALDSTAEPYSPPATAEVAANIAGDLSTEELPPIVASANDEMWQISAENAEFYLLSNDGDPKPWIRSAKRIAASFDNTDPRLARTYFLSALVETDPLVAEQHFQRALKIQTASLGLYHAETAQTLEALAWLAEHDKDSLEEAISHQRLALNIYRRILGVEAEDTMAARWKLQYFEHRLAGSARKTDEKLRLLPALAKFDR
jgi:uncharacterized tellurite resistance protein B-like protein